MEEVRHLIVPLLMGALVGIERQKSHSGKELALGLRSFVLVSLLGALTSRIESIWLQILLFGFSLSLIVISYWATARKDEQSVDLGLTTELAAGVVFFLGYISSDAPMLSALLACIVALVLFSKRSLHGFTAKIKASELQAAILLCLMGVSVVSFLPDRSLDPWKIFNPKKFGTIILILGLIEFSGYVGIKLLGRRMGSLLTGFLGGLVSSTAMTLVSARAVRKNPSSWKAQLTVVLAAQLTSLIQVIVIVASVSASLASAFLPTIIATALVLLIGLAWFHRGVSEEVSQIKLGSPLDFRNILRLAALLALILGGVTIAQNTFGRLGFHMVSFVSGLFEVHGVSFANANMFSEGRSSLRESLQAIFLAVLASLVAKVGLAWLLAKGRFAVITSITFVIAGSCGAVAFWLSV